MEKIVLKVNGMSCDHCVRAVTEELRELPSVKNINVSLKDATVALEYDPAQVSLDDIKEEITEEGFTVAD
jgi:copper chaperone